MRIFIIPLILVLLVAGYSRYWYATAENIEQQITALNIAEDNIAEDIGRMQGLQLGHRSVTVKGFPYRFETHLDQPTLSNGAIASAAPTFNWAGDKIIVVAQPWDLNHLVITVEGPQTLTTGVADKTTRTTIQSRQFRASLILKDDELDRLAVDISGLSLGSLTADRLQIHLRQLPDTTLEGALAVNNLQIADLIMGDLRLSTRGDVRLDDNQQPVGSMTVSTQDSGKVVTALGHFISVESGGDARFASSVTTALRAALLITPHAADGGISVPVSFDEGKMRLWKIPVLNIGGPN